MDFCWIKILIQFFGQKSAAKKITKALAILIIAFLNAHFLLIRAEVGILDEFSAALSECLISLALNSLLSDNFPIRNGHS